MTVYYFGRKPKYATDEERLAARRESWRANDERRMSAYTDLCERLGIPKQRYWKQHYKLLREQELQPANAALVRALRGHKKFEQYRWWLDRVSVDWIQQVGGGLDFSSVEEAA